MLARVHQQEECATPMVALYQHSCVLTSLSDIKLLVLNKLLTTLRGGVPSAAVGDVVYPVQSNSPLQCTPQFTRATQLHHHYIIFTTTSDINMQECYPRQLHTLTANVLLMLAINSRIVSTSSTCVFTTRKASKKTSQLTCIVATYMAHLEYRKFNYY